MPVRNETSTHFIDEVRIISPWAYGFAGLGFTAAMAAVVFATLTDKSGDRFYTLPILLPLGIFSGIVFACFILLIGYIYHDAGRRGMSRLAWTLIALFIPHALGIVLYFVLRKPRTLNCPQCSAAVELGFGFCPHCQCRLNAVCPQCHRGVNANAGNKFCPFCGGELGAPANHAPLPVPNPS